LEMMRLNWPPSHLYFFLIKDINPASSIDR
jgi:hypothetical protein